MSKFLKKSILLLLATANLLFTVWIILFKARILPPDYFFDADMRALNLIPTFNAEETLLNAAIFIPMGVYTALLTRKNIVSQTLSVAFVSLAFEVAQYILAYGTADVTDLISNTAGGLVGIIACRSMRRLFGAEGAAVCATLACIATAAMFPAMKFFL